MEGTADKQLEAANKKIERLENQVDKLKEVILQIAWELDMRTKHTYITKTEEEFLQKRNRPSK